MSTVRFRSHGNAIEVIVTPGPKAMGKAFEALADRLTNYRPVWAKVTPLIVENLRQNVVQQGAPLGERWKPLTQSTLERKGRWRKRTGRRSNRIGPDRRDFGAVAPPLVGRSGALLRGVTRPKVRLGEYQLLIWPGNRRYFFVQHFGSPTHKMPARPFIAMSRATTRSARVMIEEYVRREVASMLSDLGVGTL